jgi:hypothetical protein
VFQFCAFLCFYEHHPVCRPKINFRVSGFNVGEPRRARGKSDLQLDFSLIQRPGKEEPEVICDRHLNLSLGEARYTYGKLSLIMLFFFNY